MSLVASMICTERMVRLIDRLIRMKKGKRLTDDEVFRIVNKFRLLEVELRKESKRTAGRMIMRTPIGAISAWDVRNTEEMFKYREEIRLENKELARKRELRKWREG